MNPLLWLCGVICPTCWPAAYLLRADVFALRFAMILSAAPVLTTCGVAVYFAVRKPERLQSEEFQIRQQTLHLLEEKGGRVNLDVAMISKVMNPLHGEPPSKEQRP